MLVINEDMMIYYVAALMIIGFLIFIHEMGHFIAAKAVKIPVAVFSIGFGPSVFSYTTGNTEYRFSIVPFGGYVLPSIADENDFFRIPVYKRIIFSIGGPAANLLLAMILLSTANIINMGTFSGTAIIHSVTRTFEILVQMTYSLAGVFTNTENISGIIGIVSTGGKLVEIGILKALNFTVIISINLALVNLLPLPALDGGKIVLFLLEKIHPALARLHIPMAIAGWLVIISLMLYSTVNDVGKLI